MQSSDCLLPDEGCQWRDWHVPLRCGGYSLRQVLQNAQSVAANQQDIPIIVQLIENPKFKIPGFKIFNGAVNLHDHDCIHAILGRGLLSKDEAFTIGFTMGSTNRVTTAEQQLYSLAAKYLYPGPYKFDNEDIAVFKDAVHLAYVSNCEPLDELDYDQFIDMPLTAVRQALGLEEDLLLAYYRIEKRRYPDSIASQRLL